LSESTVILFGTGAHFSNAVLDQLLAQGLKPVALVLPQFAPLAIKSENELQIEVDRSENQFAIQANLLSIPMLYLPQPLQIELVDTIRAFNADYYLLACWPYLLSSEVANTAVKAALNLHPSLLPNYRGADPVTAQIEQQEANLGVSLHLLSDEFDKGDILSQLGLNFDHKSPSRDLIEKEAARAGVNLFMDAISDFGGPQWKPRSQIN